jgi:hypothetical protein
VALPLCPWDLFGYDSTIRTIHPAPGIYQKYRKTPERDELETALQ